MEPILSLPGIQEMKPFHFFDAQAQPTRCDMVVSSAQGLAIATELPQTGRAGLNQCAHTLAAKICGEYDIAPSLLILLVRYAYPGTDSYFVHHFVQGGTDLFNGFTFLGPSREPLAPLQVKELFTQLKAGQEPHAFLRAVYPLTSRQGATN